jgi:hypothetical protein
MPEEPISETGPALGEHAELPAIEAAAMRPR